MGCNERFKIMSEYICQKCGIGANIIEVRGQHNHLIGFLCSQCNLDFSNLLLPTASKFDKLLTSKFKEFVSGK